MYRIWLMFDPRRALVALVLWLAVLALTLHFIMLSTDRFNWIEGPAKKTAMVVPQVETLVSSDLTA